MRLIDADALMQATCDWGICADCEDAYKGQNVHANCSEIRLVFLCTINEAPTIEAIGMIRGEWIEEYSGNGWNDYWDYTCSNCGKKYKRANAILYKANFCPNCGARMKGENDE